MENSEKVLSRLGKLAKVKGIRFDRLYRYVCNPDLYIKAYANIYSNKGSSTRGIDEATADDFNKTRISELIDSLKDESYKAKPARRTYIPKKNGKLRPLGIPSFDDRLVQEVVRMILEAIYEPTFSPKSHGFRSHRSCHTALEEVKKTFRGVRWFIEGDIKGCFDNIDHHVLIGILRKKIADERFIRLIWKFLKAGYLENFKYHKTYSGTPQGGIVSPILANIYLNEMDKHIAETLRDELTINSSDNAKASITRNKEYHKLSSKSQSISAKIDMCKDVNERKRLIAEYMELKKQQRRTPSLLGHGNYKNLQYVRYADDFIIGVKGSKQDCQDIKAKLSKFLHDELKIELSEEKTLITNSKDRARFLNYEVHIGENNRFFKDKNGVKKRAGNWQIQLNMPRDVIIDSITKKGIVDDIRAEHWRGKARKHLINLSDLEIVSKYNAEIRGLYNYYSIATNVYKMHILYHVMEYSCLKTLAAKHKNSVKGIRNKYRVGEGWGVRYNTKTEKNKVRFFYDKGFETKPTAFTKDLDTLPNGAVYAGRTELERRITACQCEACGETDANFHIHHVNKVKDLKGKEWWERLHIERKRKTLVLCEDCHRKLHSPKTSHLVNLV